MKPDRKKQKPPFQWDDEKIKIVFDALENNMSQSQAGRLVGACKMDVAYLRRKHGKSVMKPGHVHDWSRYPGIRDLCKDMTIPELAVHYETSYKAIQSYLLHRGVKAVPVSGKPHPAEMLYKGIEHFVKDKTVRELADIYCVGENSIRRALSRRGLSAKKYIRPPAVRKPAPAPKPRVFVVHRNPQYLPMGEKILSEAEKAQRFLQRFCPVSRCNDDGRPNQTGQMFLYGRRLVTAQELIDFAKRKGWEPDAWKNVA